MNTQNRQKLQNTSDELLTLEFSEWPGGFCNSDLLLIFHLYIRLVNCNFIFYSISFIRYFFQGIQYARWVCWISTSFSPSTSCQFTAFLPKAQTPFVFVVLFENVWKVSKTKLNEEKTIRYMMQHLTIRKDVVITQHLRIQRVGLGHSMRVRRFFPLISRSFSSKSTRNINRLATSATLCSLYQQRQRVHFGFSDGIRLSRFCLLTSRIFNFSIV